MPISRQNENEVIESKTAELAKKISTISRMLTFVKKNVAVVCASIFASVGAIWYLKESNLIVPPYAGTFEITTSMGTNHTIKTKNIEDLRNQYKKIDSAAVLATLPSPSNTVFFTLEYCASMIEAMPTYLKTEEYIELINKELNFYPKLSFVDKFDNPNTLGMWTGEEVQMLESLKYKPAPFALVYIHECYHGTLTKMGKAVEKNILLKDKIEFEESERLTELSVWNFIKNHKDKNIAALKYFMLSANGKLAVEYQITGKITHDLLLEKNGLNVV